jgi:1-deoxy-D-xylulose-5-phosphate reductoisomerase
MKNIVILGSTGSIGTSALDVARRFPDRLRVVGLSVNRNTRLLARQAAEFKPTHVAIADSAAAGSFKGPRGLHVLTGSDGVEALATLKNADVVVVAIVGGKALKPLLAAIRAGKTIALANKESIVMAGAHVMALAKKTGAKIIPVDSEQSAIFQCLEGQRRETLERLYLTASGGPLWDLSAKALERVTKKRVLAHPRWKMGPKITVDSATLMNKGLEVIEARHLFDVALDKIEVVVHRQAIIHSMVSFVDGSLLAQLAVTDMRLPIQFALTYPERWPNPLLKMDPFSVGDLTFERPDMKRFPCLAIAYEASRQGGGVPAAMNAANEVAVEAFLNEEIGLGAIPRVVESVLKRGRFLRGRASLDEIIKTDDTARIFAREVVKGVSS